MPQRLACLSWTASALGWTALAVASGGLAPALSQDDLEKPEVVRSWLERNRQAPRDQAQAFQRSAERARAQGRWGAAAKGYAEAALVFPTPELLSAYAETLLRERGAMRSAASAASERRTDWERGAAILRTALAADDVLHSLRPAQRQAQATDADCLAAAASSGHADATCAPLRASQPTPPQR